MKLEADNKLEDLLSAGLKYDRMVANRTYVGFRIRRGEIVYYFRPVEKDLYRFDGCGNEGMKE